MRITFVRPHMHPGGAGDAMQPLAFSILAGLTPAHHECVLYDDRIERVPVEEPTDLVAMTVETYTARRAYELADAYRRQGVRVVMGGYHPTLIPEEAQEHADAVVIGDAEGIWHRVLEDAERGSLERRYQATAPAQLAGARYDRSIFEGKRYVSYPLVQFQRGCRFACDFCSIRAFYGENLRHRPIDEVLTEIESLDARKFFFVDDNLFSQTDATIDMLRALRGSGVRWSAQVSIDIARDAKTLDLLEQSGCQAVLIGFESLDPTSLREMRKGWNLKGPGYDACVRALRDRGIMVYGTFVFGYDHDTVDAFDISLDFALRNELFLANFNPLTPTPGTPLYDRLKAERRLIHDPWWLSEGFRYGSAQFLPAQMTPRQLTEGCFRARSAFYRYRSIARRGLDWRANSRDPRNLMLYLIANFVSRREIFHKQGQPLGGKAREAHAGQA